MRNDRPVSSWRTDPLFPVSPSALLLFLDFFIQWFGKRTQRTPYSSARDNQNKMVIFGRGGWTRLAALCWLPMAFSSTGEVGDVTSVTVDASSYDERPLLEGGCYVDGCEPDLTRDRLSTDVSQSRWSCEATEEDPCYITYTFEEARVVSGVYLYLANVTEDMSVIVYTLNSSNSSTDGDEEFVAQIVETVTGSTYSPEEESEISLQPTPLATAVRIEADLPAGEWFSILETYIYVTLEDDEVSSSLEDDEVSSSLEDDEVSSSDSWFTSWINGSESWFNSWVSVLVIAIIFCCCGYFLHCCCCGDSGAAASSSASAVATSNVQIMMPQMSNGQRMSDSQ
ncbi:unnamed protein product [Ectocarpus fasciculatus]